MFYSTVKDALRTVKDVGRLRTPMAGLVTGRGRNADSAVTFILFNTHRLIVHINLYKFDPIIFRLMDAIKTLK